MVGPYVLSSLHFSFTIFHVENVDSDRYFFTQVSIIKHLNIYVLFLNIFLSLHITVQFFSGEDDKIYGPHCSEKNVEKPGMSLNTCLKGFLKDDATTAMIF